MLPDTLIGDHNFERPDRDTDWRPILGLVETYILNQSIGWPELRHRLET